MDAPTCIPHSETFQSLPHRDGANMQSLFEAAEGAHTALVDDLSSLQSARQGFRMSLLHSAVGMLPQPEVRIGNCPRVVSTKVLQADQSSLLI